MMKHSNNPIFIVGTGRSGTTLMTGLLSSHSRIAVTPETHFLKIASRWGDPDGCPGDFDAFWSRYTRSSRFRDLEVDADRCRRRIELAGDRSFRAILSVLLDEFGSNRSKPRVGEKTPGHWRQIGRLLDWYPGARVIAMRRDPRAVVASQLKSPWVEIRPRSFRSGMFHGTRKHQITHYARNWRDAYDRGLPDWLGDHRVTLVSYERLVQDAEATLRDVCGFLGETFEPAMLDRRTAGTRTVPPGSATRDGAWKGWLKEHHGKAQQPVTTASIDKWRRELSPAEVATIEGICAPGMRSAGYGFASRPIRRSVERALSGIQSAVGLAEQQGRRALRGAVKEIAKS